MPDWIRGVNIGGWLVLERFITPYMFAITDCHTSGNFCTYPDQIGVPPGSSENYCNLYDCKPHLTESVAGIMDYPVDEFTLMQAFDTPDIAKRYLDQHYEHFVTHEDVKTLKANGVTHVRVPMGHWILGANDNDNLAPYVQASGWLYFVRFVSWCREEGIFVWPDLHTAPGSQNGFDNSGHLLPGIPTCENWSNNSTNVDQTLETILKIAKQIKMDGLTDVVTGLGILNEPFVDCDPDVVRTYNNRALKEVREILGKTTNIYIGDLFNSSKWNDGEWWQGEDYQNTFMDSHYYHVFAEEPRALSPRQHIAYVCRKNYHDTIGCCYEDAPNNTIPSKGISRIIGEWSASYDTLVVAKLDTVMLAIQETGAALEMDRQLSSDRKDFLKKFVQAQMVAYEASDVGVSSGWFFWTLKMEGGAFAEWDFLRGLKEGWIPSIPEPHVSSQELYGNCEDLVLQTKNDMSIVHEFPDPLTLDPNNWQGVAIDDDLVMFYDPNADVPPAVVDTTTAKTTTIAKTTTTTTATTTKTDGATTDPVEIKASYHPDQQHSFWFPLLAVCFFVYAIKKVFFQQSPVQERGQYEQVVSYQNGTPSMTV